MDVFWRAAVPTPPPVPRNSKDSNIRGVSHTNVDLKAAVAEALGVGSGTAIDSDCHRGRRRTERLPTTSEWMDANAAAQFASSPMASERFCETLRLQLIAYRGT